MEHWFHGILMMLFGEKRQWTKEYVEFWVKERGFSSAGLLGTLYITLEGEGAGAAKSPFPHMCLFSSNI